MSYGYDQKRFHAIIDYCQDHDSNDLLTARFRDFIHEGGEICRRDFPDEFRKTGSSWGFGVNYAIPRMEEWLKCWEATRPQLHGYDEYCEAMMAQEMMNGL